LFVLSTMVMAQNDPGPRAGSAAAGGAVANLSVKETKFFQSGAEPFNLSAIERQNLVYFPRSL